MSGIRRVRTVLALAFIAVLALGPAACLGGDGEGSPVPVRPAAASPTPNVDGPALADANDHGQPPNRGLPRPPL